MTDTTIAEAQRRTVTPNVSPDVKRAKTRASAPDRDARPIVFVVEDDPDIARLERHHLEQAGYAVQTFAAAAPVMAAAERHRPVLFLLDIMLPGSSGLDLLRQIRRSSLLAETPVIFVTARTQEPDRVTGLEVGADDYITKPFSPHEMIARIGAVLRRARRQPQRNLLRVGHLEMDFDAMTLKSHGQLVDTTTTEFRVLEHLARHPRIVFSRDQLLDAIWRDTANVGQRTVDVYVRRIREKIEADPEDPQFLKTVRGIGYRFDIPEAVRH